MYKNGIDGKLVGLCHVQSGERVDFNYVGRALFEAKLHGYNINIFPYFNHEPLMAKDVNKIVSWLLENYPDQYTLQGE